MNDLQLSSTKMTPDETRQAQIRAYMKNKRQQRRDEHDRKLRETRDRVEKVQTALVKIDEKRRKQRECAKGMKRTPLMHINGHSNISNQNISDSGLKGSTTKDLVNEWTGQSNRKYSSSDTTTLPGNLQTGKKPASIDTAQFEEGYSKRYDSQSPDSISIIDTHTEFIQERNYALENLNFKAQAVSLSQNNGSCPGTHLNQNPTSFACGRYYSQERAESVPSQSSPTSSPQQITGGSTPTPPSCQKVCFQTYEDVYTHGLQKRTDIWLQKEMMCQGKTNIDEMISSSESWKEEEYKQAPSLEWELAPLKKILKRGLRSCAFLHQYPKITSDNLPVHSGTSPRSGAASSIGAKYGFGRCSTQCFDSSVISLIADRLEKYQGEILSSQEPTEPKGRNGKCTRDAEKKCYSPLYTGQENQDRGCGDGDSEHKATNNELENKSQYDGLPLLPRKSNEGTRYTSKQYVVVHPHKTCAISSPASAMSEPFFVNAIDEQVCLSNLTCQSSVYTINTRKKPAASSDDQCENKEKHGEPKMSRPCAPQNREEGGEGPLMNLLCQSATKEKWNETIASNSEVWVEKAEDQSKNISDERKCHVLSNLRKTTISDPSRTCEIEGTAKESITSMMSLNCTSQEEWNITNKKAEEGEEGEDSSENICDFSSWLNENKKLPGSVKRIAENMIGNTSSLVEDIPEVAEEKPKVESNEVASGNGSVFRLFSKEEASFYIEGKSDELASNETNVSNTGNSDGHHKNSYEVYGHERFSSASRNCKQLSSDKCSADGGTGVGSLQELQSDLSEIASRSRGRDEDDARTASSESYMNSSFESATISECIDF